MILAFLIVLFVFTISLANVVMYDRNKEKKTRKVVRITTRCENKLKSASVSSHRRKSELRRKSSKGGK